MDFSFFTTNNKSGYKTRENWVIENNPELYKSIIEYCNNLGLELTFKEKILFYFNKMVGRPKCVTCGEEIKFRNRFDKPYGDFCSLNCINNNIEEMIKRQKNTFQKKFGVDFYPQHNQFVSKQKKTKLEKYGNENFNNSNKMKETKLEKYGNEKYNNFEKYKSTCLVKYGSDNYSKSNNYVTQMTNKYKGLYPKIKFVNIGKGEVTLKCDSCNNESTITKQLLYERYKRNYDVCTNCNPIGNFSRSGYENEICDFLSEIGVEHKTNQKLKNKKTEMDILIPQFKLAIEFNGIYWHNELHKSENYHLKKTIDCNNEGISLIHLFEDEWIYRKPIVKSILLNKFGLITTTIPARKCIVKNISSKLSKEFLEENHIQGNVNSKVKLGLYFENQLVSVMTFSKGRILMGGKKTEWELNRFCNLLNSNVIGGASKLLKYFIKTYEPSKIVSYSDIRLFDGGMYEKLGFEKISQSKPNYWYVINDLRYHRFKFRKSILVKEGFDKNKTEKEIMFNRNIYRIYDCGNIRWELNK